MKPKKKCCTSKPRCRRCPIRLLSEGKLPPGYTVRKRKLVKVDRILDAVLSDEGGTRKGKKNKKKNSSAKARIAA